MPPPDAAAVPVAAEAAAAADAKQQQPGASPRKLAVFDFDHTLADANSDTFILRCLPGGQLPPELKNSYVKGQWTDYMKRVIAHLHDEGVTASELRRAIGQLPPIDGMGPLLEALGRRGDTDCVILSDSNSLFIFWALAAWGAAWGHAPVFARVLTNPARLDAATGRLLLEPHDGHHGCASCPVNMCKRASLRRFLREQADAGVHYTRVAYVGDGLNDVCPSLALGPGDVVFARRGFALDKALAELEAAAPEAAAGAPQAAGPGPAEEEGEAPRRAPRAGVVRWRQGGDILAWLQGAWWGDEGGGAGEGAEAARGTGPSQ